MTWKKQKRHDFIQFKAGFSHHFTSLSRHKNSYWRIRDSIFVMDQVPCLQSSSWSLETTFDVLTLGGRLVFGKLPMAGHHATSYNGIIWRFWNLNKGLTSTIGWYWMWWDEFHMRMSIQATCTQTFRNKGGYRIHLSSKNSALLGVNGRTYNLQPRCFMFCSKALTG